MGFQFHHGQGGTAGQHTRQQRGEQADHADVVTRLRVQRTQRIAAGRRPVARALEEAACQRIGGRQAHGALRALATGKSARHGQRVGPGQAQAAVLLAQLRQRVVQQHVTQAQAAIVQFQGAELAARLARPRVWRQVQSPHAGQHHVLRQALQLVKQIGGKSHGWQLAG